MEIALSMMLGGAVIIALFCVFDFVSTRYQLKKNQEEWDELKAEIIKANPDKSRFDLLDVYIDFCKEKETHLPRF